MACPDELTDIAAESWNRTIVPLFAYGIITVADRDMAIALCQAWKCYVEARARCERDGYELQTEYGPKVNPSQKCMWESLDRYFRLAPHFGIMPANRSRVTNAITKRPAGEGEAQNKSRFFSAKAV